MVTWACRRPSRAIGTFVPRPRACAPRAAFSKAEEIAKLDLLRKEGILSEEEFQEQKRRILGDVAKNGVLMGSLGSEVNHQESVASKDTKTRLFFHAGMEPVEGGFLANASKHFCSNGPVAKYLLYWSIAPGAETSRDGLTLSIVEAGKAPDTLLKRMSVGGHGVPGHYHPKDLPSSVWPPPVDRGDFITQAPAPEVTA